MSLTDWIRDKTEDAAATTYDVPEDDAWPELRLIDQTAGTVQAVTVEGGSLVVRAG